MEATLNREDLGLPANWETVEDWLNETRDIAAPLDLDPPPMDVKNPEVDVLPRYDVPAPPQFWEKFPKNFPDSIRKSVNLPEFEKLINKCWQDWTVTEQKTARKALERLRGSKLTKLSKDLPP